MRTTLVTLQIRTIVIAVAASLLALLAVGIYAVGRVDTDALARQKALATNALHEEHDDFARQHHIATQQEDAAAKTHERELGWIDRYLGRGLDAAFGHDRVYVIDREGNIVYAMQDGRELDHAQAALPRELKATVTRVQAERAAEQHDGMPTAQRVNTMLLAGEPAMVSVAAIRPSDSAIAPVPGAEYLHVSVKHLDLRMLSELGERYRLPNIRFTSPTNEGDEASIPVVGAHNQVLGYIAWDAIQPGRSLIDRILPVLVVVGLLITAVMAYLLRRFQRTTLKLQASEAEAQYLAFHDPLTGLPNRALFNTRLREALEKGAERANKTALLYIDLDRFKHINDTLGHPAGDELVRIVAQRLQDLVRAHDTVSRLGGDEFAIVLEDIEDLSTVNDIAERLIASLAEPFDLAGEIVHIGGSVGVVVAPDAGIDAADLRRKADIALYEAKKNGRGRYQIFTGGMDEILARRRRIESELRAALKEDHGLALVYQPILSPDGITVLGAEALLRWRHPVHGAIPTAQFVAIAEERGLILALGNWVIAAALDFLTTTDLPWVAVNVSPIQLREHGFAERLLEQLRERGIEPLRLQVEITEGVLLEGKRNVTTALRLLRAAGVTIALDDFGTGYSSLGYLRRHTIDKLKIDRTFVRELGRGPESDAIVKTVVDLAKALGLRVTAEGVETVTQLSRAVILGCSEFQGFLLSEPLCADDMRRRYAHPLPRLIADHRRA